MKKLFQFFALGCASLLAMLACFGCGSETKVKVIEIPLTEEQYAIAVQKGNTELRDRIDAALGEIIEDGTFASIYEKYNTKNQDEIDGIVLKTESSDRSKELILATSADFPPFENKKGDKFVGIDIEIAVIIAEKLGKELILSNMIFDSVIPAVQEGKADFGMAGLTVNADRANEVDFTRSYIDATQYVIVREGDTTFDQAETSEEINELIASKRKIRIGAQQGTTGYNFAKGSEAFEYTGFANARVSPYTSGILAIKDLAVGRLDIVILDKLPSISLAADHNARIEAQNAEKNK